MEGRILTGRDRYPVLMKICSVYDAKVGAYAQPMFCQSAGQALRTFQDIANDKEHPIGQHPEDYTLFELGTWDEVSGVITPHPARKALGQGHELQLLTED